VLNEREGDPVSHRHRPSHRRRWWAFGLVGALLLIAGVGSAVRPIVDEAQSATTTSEVRVSQPVVSATPGPAPAETWSAPLGIPADATDDERLQIKLSYDLVSVPLDQFERLQSLPGVTVVSPRTFGDAVYAAVRETEVAAVRDALPEATVIPNEVVHADETQTPAPSWGLDAVDDSGAVVDGAYLYDSTGVGVTAFIVDSGVQSDHPDFGGRVDAAAGHDEVGDGRGTEDCNGHGTHVAGTVG
jgi:subtilisin family serine protease